LFLQLTKAIQDRLDRQLEKLNNAPYDSSARMVLTSEAQVRVKLPYDGTVFPIFIFPDIARELAFLNICCYAMLQIPMLSYTFVVLQVPVQ
jgi:hypothetical protein